MSEFGREQASAPMPTHEAPLVRVRVSNQGLDEAEFERLIKHVGLSVAVEPLAAVRVDVQVEAARTLASTAPTPEPVSAQQAPRQRTFQALLALEGAVPTAQQEFREVIVALESMPGNEVQGISPLYHVSHVDGADTLTSVVRLTTLLEPEQLAATARLLRSQHSEQHLAIDVLDVHGEQRDEADCQLPYRALLARAAVLAPLFDMDPQTSIEGLDIAYALAMAPDSAQVGLYSDHWIMGATQ